MVEWLDRLKALLHRGDEARMVVTERGRHLSGAEIQVALACGVDDLDALGPRHDRAILEPGHVGPGGSRDHPFLNNVLRRLGIHLRSLRLIFPLTCDLL